MGCAGPRARPRRGAGRAIAARSRTDSPHASAGTARRQTGRTADGPSAAPSQRVCVLPHPRAVPQSPTSRTRPVPRAPRTEPGGPSSPRAARRSSRVGAGRDPSRRPTDPTVTGQRPTRRRSIAGMPRVQPVRARAGWDGRPQPGSGPIRWPVPPAACRRIGGSPTGRAASAGLSPRGPRPRWRRYRAARSTRDSRPRPSSPPRRAARRRCLRAPSPRAPASTTRS